MQLVVVFWSLWEVCHEHLEVGTFLFSCPHLPPHRNITNALLKGTIFLPLPFPVPSSAGAQRESEMQKETRKMEIRGICQNRLFWLPRHFLKRMALHAHAGWCLSSTKFLRFSKNDSKDSKEKNIEMKYRNKFFYKLMCLGSDWE